MRTMNMRPCCGFRARGAECAPAHRILIAEYACVPCVAGNVRQRTDGPCSPVQAARMSLPHPIPAPTFPRWASPACDLQSLRTGFGSCGPLGESPLRMAALPLAAIAGPEMRILVADEECSAGGLVRLLHGLGYCLTKMALCGASALELAQEFQPSVVLIALDLPDMSARCLARRLRARTGTAPLRLIALAADPSLAGRHLARESGFSHHLAKPVAVVALRRVLRARLA